MENISANILKALSIYGSNLGLERFKITRDEPWRRGTLTFEMPGTYYFSLTSEVSRYEDKNSKYRHCVPNKGGFYDYSVKKRFSDLEAWYLDAREDIPQQGEIPWSDGILYGRRHKLYTKAIPLSELAPLLEPRLGVAVHEPKPDSFDLLLPLVPGGWTSGRKNFAGFYIDPASGKHIKCSFMNNMRGCNWTPTDPRWVVYYYAEAGPQDPVFRTATCLSDMGITADDIFLPQFKNWSHSYERLSDLVK